MTRLRGSGFAKRITLDNLDRFLPLLSKKRDASHPETSKSKEESEEDRALAEASSLFDGEPIVYSIPFTPTRRTGVRRKKPSIRHKPPRIPTGTPVTPIQYGPELWRKRLAATDAQRQHGNPTGVVRLAQAGYRAGGRLIDKTRYFRHEIWGRLSWRVSQRTPRKEDVSIPFNIIVLGNNLGVKSLKVSHQPSRISGQGNVPTVLHWGTLGDYIRQANLVGKTLSLFGPSPGSQTPYFIVIS